MHDRTHEEIRFQKCTILVIHDRHRCTCRTVGCDCREAEHRLIICDTQTFYRIQCFAPSYSKYHICFLINRHPAKLFYRRIGTVFPIKFFSNNLQIRLVDRHFDLIKSRIKCPFSTNHKYRFSIRFTDRSDFIVNCISDGIIREMSPRLQARPSSRPRRRGTPQRRAQRRSRCQTASSRGPARE